MQLQDWLVKEDFLPLELGGVDVIFGMQWLYSLRVPVDWKNLSLSFSCEGKQINIKGDPNLTKARVSLKNMIRSWGEKDEGFLMECCAITVEGLNKSDCLVTNLAMNKDRYLLCWSNLLMCLIGRRDYLLEGRLSTKFT